MMRLTSLLLFAFAATIGISAQETEITSAQAKSMYSTTSKKRVSVHDPSVVWDSASKRYYIFGSHRGIGYTTDMQNWTGASFNWKTASSSSAANKDAFVTPAVKKVTIGGVEKDFPQFNAVAWSALGGAQGGTTYSVDGNMWAPDVIWNPTMNKWCMYLSINGDSWMSSIILLTADKITGPYLYQGPVVICGFRDATRSYKDTDLELVIGEQATLPTRYARTGTTGGQMWGDRWPHTIDPAVFYDENGKLWMVYGSWSGGIWMLELNEETGLRDYDVTYPSTGGSTNTVTSDPYFGKKIAGGLYVSGEGPYIEHIGDYYYLFVSYGGFAPDGGYEMRVFRSKDPDGPYTDAKGNSAIFTSWVKNYGAGTDTRGEKILGSYNGWGFQTVGECAQGHNSIINVKDDDRTYLVYHTKFNDGTIGHQVRVHQVFQNKGGWLVAAPFEYNGEGVTDTDIATKQQIATSDIPGTYEVLIHKYKMDYENMEEVTPKTITLTADGKVSGAYTGTWSMTEGTSYVTITLGGIYYNGVLFEEQMDDRSIKTISFTGTATNGVCLWAYRMRPDYAVAWHVNTQSVPVSEGGAVSTNVDLYKMYSGDANVALKWSSSQPQIISEYGRYNPEGLSEAASVELTARLTSGNYFWQTAYNVKAQADTKQTGDWETGMLAHYDFDDEELTNSYDKTQKAVLKRNSTTALPTIIDDELQLRNEKVVNLKFGANGKESYVEFMNPFYQQTLTDGATVSFWVRRLDDTNLWDALCGFYDATTQGRLYLTGNTYVGYNNNQGIYLDINHPTTIQRTDLNSTRWMLVTLVFSRESSQGVKVYVNGTSIYYNYKYAGKIGDKEVSTKTAFDYNYIVDHLAKCEKFYFGYGSFWGSAAANYDDLLFFNRALSMEDVKSLYNMQNRVFNFRQYIETGIADVTTDRNFNAAPTAVYDLSGRQLNGEPTKKGLYISNGKKYFVK